MILVEDFSLSFAELYEFWLLIKVLVLINLPIYNNNFIKNGTSGIDGR